MWIVEAQGGQFVHTCSPWDRKNREELQEYYLPHSVDSFYKTEIIKNKTNLNPSLSQNNCLFLARPLTSALICSFVCSGPHGKQFPPSLVRFTVSSAVRFSSMCFWVICVGWTWSAVDTTVKSRDVAQCLRNKLHIFFQIWLVWDCCWGSFEADIKLLRCWAVSSQVIHKYSSLSPVCITLWLLEGKQIGVVAFFFCCHFQHHLRWRDVCICFSGLILVFVRPNVDLHPNSESIPLLIDRVSVLIVLISPLFTKRCLTLHWNKFKVNRYFLKESLKDYWFQSLFGVSCDFFDFIFGYSGSASVFKTWHELNDSVPSGRGWTQAATDHLPRSSGWMSVDRKHGASCKLYMLVTDL